MNITSVGAVLMLVRVFDAITDPLMGVLSDGTRSRMGRRRPYILMGSICLALSIFMFFLPPRWEGGAAFAWFTISVISLFLFWTVVTVPYEALGPALTSDYSERTSLFAMRDGLLISGTLLAAASPAIIEAFQVDPVSADSQRSKFFWIALFYAPLLIGTCLWCFWRIREPSVREMETKKTDLNNLKAVLRNRPFLILLSSYTIGALGSNLPATLILYYVEYVLESTRADLFLFLYLASGILMLPLWIRWSKRYGKKKPGWHRWP